jgi:hypothetical protein
MECRREHSQIVIRCIKVAEGDRLGKRPDGRTLAQGLGRRPLGEEGRGFGFDERGRQSEHVQIGWLLHHSKFISQGDFGSASFNLFWENCRLLSEF